MHASDFVESYIDAWNHHDPAGVAKHMATNGVYCDIPESAQRSQQEVITNLQKFFARYRHRYELLGDILTNGNTIAFQYEMIPSADGRNHNRYRGAEFITMDHDAALTIIDYYDVPGIEPPTDLLRATTPVRRRRKYAKSGLDPDTAKRYQGRLLHLMQHEQIYLRPDLTLPRLATAVNCSVNHLSQVINAGFGVSFFDYLNRYRVDHAKTLLTQLNGHDNAILKVAYAVGFNSNSAFYTAFKKYVGQTPAQYRKEHAELQH